MLGAIGRPVRRRAGSVLQVLALGARVGAWTLAPSSWSAPARVELFARLRQALLGGLPATLVLGLLIGAGLVFQGIALAGVAGQRTLLAEVLVRVLVRELAPALIGLLILGRSGLVIAAELGAMRGSGGARALVLQGVDLLRVFALPAAVALALACFTLGVVFVGVALVSGGALAWYLGDGQVALFESLGDVLRAMRPADAVIFPAKLLVVGGLVGLIATHAPLAPAAPLTTAQLLPAAFVRGALVVLAGSAVLSLVA